MVACEVLTFLHIHQFLQMLVFFADVLQLQSESYSIENVGLAYNIVNINECVLPPPFGPTMAVKYKNGPTM